MTQKIRLTQGKFALVSDEDYDRVSKHRWHAIRIKKRYNTVWYARSGSFGVMHNFIMRPIGSLEVDHINGNGLDNRRSNLRLCTHRQNSMNRHNYSDLKSSSGYRGVYRVPKSGKWIVNMRNNFGVQVCLGTFTNKRIAALAYDAMALEFHGEFANLNFPRRSKREFANRKKRRAG